MAKFMELLCLTLLTMVAHKLFCKQGAISPFTTMAEILPFMQNKPGAQTGSLPYIEHLLSETTIN